MNKMMTVMAFVLMVATILSVAPVQLGDEVDGEVVQIGSIEYTIVKDTHYRTYVEAPSPYLYIKAPSIQDGCFYNVQNIERVVCDRSVKSIGESAFASSSIDYIDTGGSESIGTNAFMNSDLRTVALEPSMTSIGDYAFKDTPYLEDVNLIDSSVTRIANGVFEDSGIGILDLRGITSVDSTAFRGSSLKAQVVTSSQGALVSGVSKVVCDDLDLVDRFGYRNGSVTAQTTSGTLLSVSTSDGAPVDVTYTDSTTHGTNTFTVSSGKDYLIGVQKFLIVFQDALGLDDVSVMAGSGGYSLPTPSVQGLVFSHWTVSGINGEVTRLTDVQMATIGNPIEPVAHFGSVHISFDHSYIEGCTDTMPADGGEFTLGSTLPDVDDIDGYRFVGWEIDGTIVSPGTELSDFTVTEIVGVWEPTRYSTVTYLDSDGTVLATETYEVHRDVALCGHTPAEDIDKMFAGWSLSPDGETISADGTIDTSSDVTLYPIFIARPLLSITYLSDGSVLLTEDFHSGRTATITSTIPEKEWHAFVHWSDGHSTYDSGDTFTMESDMTLDAVWTELPTATLTYDSGYGTETSRHLVGSEVTVDSTPSIAGKEFLGWTTVQGSDVTHSNGDTIEIVSDTTLHAVWRDIPVITVTFMDGDSELKRVSDYQGAVFDVDVSIPDETFRTFLGWSVTEGSDSAEYTVGSTIEPDSDVILYSVWDVTPTSTVRFVDGTVIDSVTVATGDTVDIPQGPVKGERDVFLGWTDDDGTEFFEGDTMVTDGDTDLHATWGLRVYLSYSYGGGNMSEHLRGDTVTVQLNVDVSEGEEFLGWSTASDDDEAMYVNGQSIVIESDITLYPVIRDIPVVTITFMDGDTQVDSVSGYLGTVFTITTSMTDGEFEDFLGWSLNASSDSVDYLVGSSIEPNSDVVLYSVWDITPTSTIRFMDGAVLESKTVATGQTVSVPEGPVKGDRDVFLGWSVGDADDPTYHAGGTVVIDRDMDLHAVWGQKVYLAYSTEPNDKQSLLAGDTVTVDRTHHGGEGWEFVGWSVDQDSNVPDYVVGDRFTITSDTTLYPVLSEIPIVTVRFMDSGTQVGSMSGYLGSTLTVSESLQDEQFKHFLGWSEDDVGVVGYPVGSTITPQSDTVLHAVWDITPTSTVTYVDTDIIDTITVATGYSLEIMDGPVAGERDVFLGWTVHGQDDVMYSAGDTITVDRDMELHATWGRIVILTYQCEGGTTTEHMAGDDVTIGLSVTVPEGERFLGWASEQGSDAPTYLNGQIVTIIDDLMLYPVFEQLPVHSLTFMDGETTVHTTSGYEGSTITVSQTLDDRQFARFLGWGSADEMEYVAGDSLALTHDIVLYAIWDVTPTSTLRLIDGDTVHEETVATGDSVTITMNLQDSQTHIFGGWVSTEGTVYVTGDTIVMVSDMDLDAVWILKVELTYMDGVPTTTVHLEGDTVTVMNEMRPERGRFLMGWSETEGSGTAGFENGDTFTITCDTVLYPVWGDLEPITVDIGGSIHTLYPGETVTVTEELEDRRDSEFGGWSTTEGSQEAEYTVGSEILPDGDVTLYPVWIPIPRADVTYHLDTGDETDLHYVGETATIHRPVGTDEWHAFDGWSTSEDGDVVYNDGEQVVLTGPLSLHPIVSEIPSGTLTYRLDSGDVQDRYHIGDEVVIGTDPGTKDGFRFVGWSTTGNPDVSFVDGDVHIVSGDLTLYPVWVQLGTFAVTVMDTTVEVQEGGSFTLPGQLEDDDHRDHIGWSVSGTDGVLDPGTEIVVDRDIVVTPVWSEPYAHDITIDLGDGTEIEVTVDAGEGFDTGEIEVPPSEGMELVGWSETGPEGPVDHLPGDVIDVDGDIVLHPVWAELHTVRFIIDGEVFHEKVVVDGDDVIAPESDDPRGLTGWSYGDTVVVPDMSFTPLEDVDLGACWAKPYLVVLSSEGRVISSGYHSEGDVIDLGQLDVPTKDGHTFIGWADSEGHIVDSITVGGDLTLEARWRCDVEPKTVYVNVPVYRYIEKEVPVKDDTADDGGSDGTGGTSVQELPGNDDAMDPVTDPIGLEPLDVTDPVEEDGHIGKSLIAIVVVIAASVAAVLLAMHLRRD